MVDFPLLEEQLERDMQVLRDHFGKMAKSVLRQLEDAVASFTERNRGLGYTVVLRDHRIDVAEDRIDRLCQEFLVRHMPVSKQLRFVMAMVKVNSELERIGDYAEAIARRAVRLWEVIEIPERDQILEMSKLAFQMLARAVEAFLANDAETAVAMLNMDRKVDGMNSALFESLARPVGGQDDLRVRFALLGLINRIERVADRACNIAEETVYVTRGEVLRHYPRSDTRVLFLDEGNACLSQMAEAIARKLAPVHFFFTSAGLHPTSLDSRAVEFLQRQGIDISRQRPKELDQVGKLDDFNVIVVLSTKAEESCLSVPYQVVQLNWDISEPCCAKGCLDELEKTYREVYEMLCGKIKDLTEGLLGASLEEENA